MTRDDVEASIRFSRQQGGPTFRQILQELDYRYRRHGLARIRQRFERLPSLEAARQAGRVDALRSLSPHGRARELRRE